MLSPFKQPRKPWKHLLAGSLTILVATALTIAAAGLNELNGLVGALGRTPAAHLAGELTPAGAGQPQTILLMGSDKRARRAVDSGGPPHTDTMMLARVDPAQGGVALMSIPRDLRVQIDAPGGPITGKINSAYSIGGARLALHTVETILGIRVNHLVDTNFAGFRRAVDYLDCVYVDVDHKYFNDNSGPERYAAIDVPAGYQRLCGGPALDYVRYRHLDSDFVRVARQQDFVRQVRDQLGTSALLAKRIDLAKIIGSSTHTDLHSAQQVLRLLEVLALSAGHPIRQVHFPATPGPSYVTASPAQLARAAHDLVTTPRHQPRAAAAPARPRRTPRASAPQTRSLDPDQLQGRLAASRLVGAGIPVYVPTLVAPGATYDAGSRAYTLADSSGRQHRAYRLVVKMGSPGDYYGIEGTDWLDPPLLRHPSESRTIGGRHLDLYYTSGRLRLVAWHAGGSVYWVSNSLVQALDERQMLGLASSAQPVGGP